jgi:hypothetical protein
VHSFVATSFQKVLAENFRARTIGIPSHQQIEKAPACMQSEALSEALREALGEALREAIREAIREALREAISEEIREAIREALRPPRSPSSLYLWRRCGNQHAIRGHQSNEVVPMAAVWQSACNQRSSE